MLRVYRLISWLLLVGTLLTPEQVFSAAEVEPVDGTVRQQLRRILDREGYIGQYRNGQELQRGISAYLWDHRQWLKKSDFHKAVQVDVLVCLMIKRGYPGFEQCADNQGFMQRCRGLLK